MDKPANPQVAVRVDNPLLVALEDIVKHGSHGRRTEMLTRITDLFVSCATGFTEAHVQFFDEVFDRLIAEIETKARFELSVRLAEVSNAPPMVVRRLAQDDDIVVARPVLQRSQRLEEPDLLDVAKSKSQLHLLAISSRDQIAETVTDVLVRRGDREVVRNVAANLGARLSQAGFSTLVRKAEKDGILAEKVGQRADIPEPLLRELFIQAAQVVQKRLFATATPESRVKIERVLADISSEFGVNGPLRDEGITEPATTQPQGETRLDEAALTKLAEDGRYQETIAGLSGLCKIPVQNMHRIMGKKGADPALVVCRALGFGWSAARAIILLQTKGLGMSMHSLEGKRRTFDKLTAAGAQEVMRLWYAKHDE